MNRSASTTPSRSLLAGLALATTIVCSGCQTGMTSATNYLDDQMRYFTASSRFKVEGERDELKAYKEQYDARVFVDAPGSATSGAPANSSVNMSAR